MIEFIESNLLWEKRDFIPLSGTDKGELVGTNYEKKYHKEGRFVYAMEIRKHSERIIEPIPANQLLNVAYQSTDIYLDRSIQ